VPGRRGSLKERFESKVHKTSYCWMWTGAKSSTGYGSIGSGRRRDPVLHAHRVSWAMYRGAIPKGMYVLHCCDNRLCVNPEHLFLGTHATNMKDMREKGRQSRGASRPLAKLTEKQVQEIRQRYNQGGCTQREMAIEYGMGQAEISDIITRKKWKHV
jgi:hypothetical protein